MRETLGYVRQQLDPMRRHVRECPKYMCGLDRYCSNMSYWGTPMP
jgi:hypothetical protein